MRTRLQADLEAKDGSVASLQRQLDEALDSGRHQTKLEAECKKLQFDLEALQTRLKAKEMEATEAKGQREAADKREDDLKRSLAEKEAVEDSASKQLADVRRKESEEGTNWIMIFANKAGYTAIQSRRVGQER